MHAVGDPLLRRGILWSGFQNMSFAHGPAEVDELLEAWAEVLPILADAVDSGMVRSRLRGAPLQPVFRRTSSFNTRPRRRLRREAHRLRFPHAARRR